MVGDGNGDHDGVRDMRAIFRGLAHRIHWLDAELASVTGVSLEEVRGLPARELWVGYGDVQDAMDRCFATGERQVLPSTTRKGETGVVVIRQVTRSGRPWGVATAWVELPVQLQPEPDPVPVPLLR